MKKVSIVLIALALITLFSCNVEGVTKPESNTTLPINKEQFTGDLTWQLQVTSISDLVTLPSQDGSFTWKEIKDLNNDEKNILLENLTSGYWKIEVRGKDKDGSVKKYGEFITSFNETKSLLSLPSVELSIKDHQHTKDTNWSFDDKEHWHNCLICDDELDKAKHEWKQSEDGKTYICTVCKYEVDAYDHTHNYSIWGHDDNNHWKACSICGEKEPDTTEEHNLLVTYNYDASRNYLTVYEECSVCHYKTGDKDLSKGDGIIDLTYIEADIKMRVEHEKGSLEWTFIAETQNKDSSFTWLINNKELSAFGPQITPTEKSEKLTISFNTSPDKLNDFFENYNEESGDRLLVISCSEFFEGNESKHLMIINLRNNDGQPS